MKFILTILLFLAGVSFASALVVSEVMSNPTGDDNGREWIELYNDASSDADLSSLSVSIKGGTATMATPLQGGINFPANGYVIIGSVVSGATKFLQDYPNYAGILFKSSVSLVNTGVTSIDIKLNGSTVASIPSYTAAKEGYTYSYIGGSYVTGNPTPGTDNQAADTPSSSSSNSSSTSTTTNQVVLPQMAPPSPDIVIYMPEEKTVVAGAESEFSVFSLTRDGKPINDLIYSWAFGDGGQGTGSTTKYTYLYSGRYVAQVEARNASISGKGKMTIRAVPPDIEIAGFGSGKYGAYVEIHNPNTYELDLSGWLLNIDGASYPFPKNTLLPSNETIRFSGSAMGFAKREIGASSSLRVMFPNSEEVTRYLQKTEALAVSLPVATAAKKTTAKIPNKQVLGISTTSIAQVTQPQPNSSKDTRLVRWLKALFR